MPLYNFRGVDVEFPYEAYECQKVYMEKVIEALQTVRRAVDYTQLAALLGKRRWAAQDRKSAVVHLGCRSLARVASLRARRASV